MPTPPDSHQNNAEILGAISTALSSFWAWLIPMVGGLLHMGRLQQRIDQMEEQTKAIMDIKLDVKELKTKMDIMLQERNHH
jgi:hypothetical protein